MLNLTLLALLLWALIWWSSHQGDSYSHFSRRFYTWVTLQSLDFLGLFLITTSSFSAVVFYGSMGPRTAFNIMCLHWLVSRILISFLAAVANMDQTASLPMPGRRPLGYNETELASRKYGGQVRPVDLQGMSCYTVIGGPNDNKIIQFREQSSSLDMGILALARDIRREAHRFTVERIQW